MKINEGIEDFINYCIFEKGLSDKTKDSYLNDLNIYQKFLNERHINKVKEISSDDIKDFLKYRKTKETSNTIAHNLTVIKNFHAYLFQNKLVSKNVSEFIERPKLKKALPKALGVEDIEELLNIPLKDAFDYRNKAMLELTYGAGLRVSEVINLTLNDIDFSNCLIRIMGKGNKEREVPLGEYALEYLNLYLEKRKELIKGQNCDKLFLNNHGKGITRQGFFKMIKKLLEEKAIRKDVSPHTLRHSFATHLVNQGADLRSVQEMLGHADISTTKIYAEVSDYKVKEDYDKFHPHSHK